MEVTRLGLEHLAAYRAMMLRAYAEHASAFTSSAQERTDLPLEWWGKRLDTAPDAREIVLGALENGTLRGVAGLAFENREKTRHKATLFGMAVAGSHQNQGTGRLLVQAALASARARSGVRLVQLTVTQGNERAAALYRRCGFVEYGLEPFAVSLETGVFASKVHMWCNLSCPPVSSG